MAGLICSAAWAVQADWAASESASVAPGFSQRSAQAASSKARARGKTRIATL
jgi:hypothetical protein